MSARQHYRTTPVIPWESLKGWALAAAIGVLFAYFLLIGLS